MTLVLCSYCGLSFMLKANNIELRRWRHWSCRVPICLYEGVLCQFSSPPDIFVAWVDIGIFWLSRKHRSGELAHSLLSWGDLWAPGLLDLKEQQGWGDTARGPEIPGAFCFPLPYLCYSRGQQSFTAPFCCNLHMNDNTAHTTEIPYQIFERMVIYELQGISQ